MNEKEKLTEATIKALIERSEEADKNVNDIENIMSKYPEFILEEKDGGNLTYNYKNILVTFNTSQNYCRINSNDYIDDIALKNGYRPNSRFRLADAKDFMNLINNIFKNTIDDVSSAADFYKYNILNKNLRKYVSKLKTSLDNYLNLDMLKFIEQYRTKMKPAITKRQFIQIASNIQKIALNKYNIEITTGIYKPKDKYYEEGWTLEYTFRDKKTILGVAREKDEGDCVGIFINDEYYPNKDFYDDEPNYLEQIQDYIISYIDKHEGAIIKKEKNAELNKTRLKYNIVYYLNTATQERREETREDVDNDYCSTVEYFDTDLEAFKYVMTDILDLDPEDYYETEETDDEKIKTIIQYFENQDYSDGDIIICKVAGKKYRYDSGLTKKSFYDMVAGIY